MSAPTFPVASALSGSGGELVQSLTYRESYAPVYPSSVYDPPAHRRLLADAPDFCRTAAGASWALVSVAAAGCVLLVLVLLVIRVVGWLT